MITYDYLGLWTLRVVTCAQRLDMLRTQDHQFVAWNDFHCVDSVELLYCSCEDSDLSGNVFDVTLNQSSYFESHQSHLFKNPTLLHWIFWSLLHRPLGIVRGKAYVICCPAPGCSTVASPTSRIGRRVKYRTVAMWPMWPGAIAARRERHQKSSTLNTSVAPTALLIAGVWEKRWQTS